MTRFPPAVYAIRGTAAYQAIAQFYGDRRAERSRVPLINHIDQGLVIMEACGATMNAMEAYCLHPLFQNDKELVEEGISLLAWRPTGSIVNVEVVMLVMEYRNQANKWLSDKVKMSRPDPDLRIPCGQGKPTAGPLTDVKHMLIGDKVQNYKDFIAHHAGTHARSAELDFYFKTWLEALGVDDHDFKELVELANAVELQGDA